VITLTQGSLNNNYINLGNHLGFFPADAVGEANSRDGEGRHPDGALRRPAPPGEDRHRRPPHKDFRQRKPIREFFERHGLKAGEMIAIEKLSDYEYRVLPAR
jgi:hypothetical protein